MGYWQAMSQQNVQLLRTLFDGWARGDFGAGSDALAHDFVWRQLHGVVEPGSHQGARAGEALRRIFEVYEDFSVKAEEYIDAGDKVIVVARSHGIARASRLEMNQRLAFVWTVRDGKLVDNVQNPSRHRALAALGLADKVG
jgi:uncharacterized protein